MGCMRVVQRTGALVAAGVVALLLSAGPAAAQFARATITSGPESETQATVATFEFTTSGPAPLSSFECRLDGGPWAACTSPEELTGLTGGPHHFQVRLVGTLTDGTPDEHRWTVALQTEVLPPPLPAPPPVPPPKPLESRKPVRRDARGCAYGANRPGEFRDVILERATVCLINRERRVRGLRTLRRNASLQRAAARHAHDMVRRNYFAHTSPSGRRVNHRVTKSGYLRGAGYWTVGEVLAWQRPRAGTPDEMVRAWVRSRTHLETLLLASFRDVGVGIAHGTPGARKAGATYTANLGRRD